MLSIIVLNAGSKFSNENRNNEYKEGITGLTRKINPNMNLSFHLSSNPLPKVSASALFRCLAFHMAVLRS